MTVGRAAVDDDSFVARANPRGVRRGTLVLFEFGAMALMTGVPAAFLVIGGVVSGVPGASAASLTIWCGTTARLWARRVEVDGSLVKVHRFARPALRVRASEIVGVEVQNCQVGMGGLPAATVALKLVDQGTVRLLPLTSYAFGTRGDRRALDDGRWLAGLIGADVFENLGWPAPDDVWL